MLSATALGKTNEQGQRARIPSACGEPLSRNDSLDCYLRVEPVADDRRRVRRLLAWQDNGIAVRAASGAVDWHSMKLCRIRSQRVPRSHLRWRRAGAKTAPAGDQAAELVGRKSDGAG
jgi:hypothetical protein